MTNAGLLIRAAATAQVVVEDLDAPELSQDDNHHLTKVLRLRAGERVIVTNGRGSWRVCDWTPAGLDPAGELQMEPKPSPVAVAFALTKGDKPEWTVQKLTEIGVDRIVPVISERSIVRWDADKIEKNARRFQKIAYEASMQSRRVHLPDVETTIRLADLPMDEFALAAPGGDPIAAGQQAVAVGPEGGWSDAELQGAKRTVDLGSTILRAETAALSAAVRLCSARN